MVSDRASAPAYPKIGERLVLEVYDRYRNDCHPKSRSIPITLSKAMSALSHRAATLSPGMIKQLLDQVLPPDAGANSLEIVRRAFERFHPLQHNSWDRLHREALAEEFVKFGRRKKLKDKATSILASLEGEWLETVLADGEAENAYSVGSFFFYNKGYTYAGRAYAREEPRINYHWQTTSLMFDPILSCLLYSYNFTSPANLNDRGFGAIQLHEVNGTLEPTSDTFFVDINHGARPPRMDAKFVKMERFGEALRSRGWPGEIPQDQRNIDEAVRWLYRQRR